MIRLTWTHLYCLYEGQVSWVQVVVTGLNSESPALCKPLGSVLWRIKNTLCVFIKLSCAA